MTGWYVRAFYAEPGSAVPPTGGVGLWGILAPLGALVFRGVGSGIRWFVAWLVLFLGSGVMAILLGGQSPLPGWFSSLMLALNKLDFKEEDDIMGAGAFTWSFADSSVMFLTASLRPWADPEKAVAFLRAGAGYETLVIDPVTVLYETLQDAAQMERAAIRTM